MGRIGYRTKEQQNQATKRYRQTTQGKEKIKYNNYKSKTKNFIFKIADIEELEEIKKWCNEKEKILKMEDK